MSHLLSKRAVLQDRLGANYEGKPGLVSVCSGRHEGGAGVFWRGHHEDTLQLDASGGKGWPKYRGIRCNGNIRVALGLYHEFGLAGRGKEENGHTDDTQGDFPDFRGAHHSVGNHIFYILLFRCFYKALKGAEERYQQNPIPKCSPEKRKILRFSQVATWQIRCAASMRHAVQSGDLEPRKTIFFKSMPPFLTPFSNFTFSHTVLFVPIALIS